jgi:hypothetical protein
MKHEGLKPLLNFFINVKEWSTGEASRNKKRSKRKSQELQKSLLAMTSSSKDFILI